MKISNNPEDDFPNAEDFIAALSRAVWENAFETFAEKYDWIEILTAPKDKHVGIDQRINGTLNNYWGVYQSYGEDQPELSFVIEIPKKNPLVEEVQLYSHPNEIYIFFNNQYKKMTKVH